MNTYNMLIIIDIIAGIVFAHIPITQGGAAMEKAVRKFIVIGAMDGVPSEAIAVALREKGHEVVFSINQFFV